MTLIGKKIISYINAPVTGVVNTVKNFKEKRTQKKEREEAKKAFSDIGTKENIDLITNHYQTKIESRYPEQVDSQKPLLKYVEGEKIKVTQAKLKNNLQDITQTLAFLKHNKKASDTKKIKYLADSFSKRALNVLGGTLDKDITKDLKPKDYNHLGIVKAVFKEDTAELDKVKAILASAITLKDPTAVAPEAQSVTSNRQNVQSSQSSPLQEIPILRQGYERVDLDAEPYPQTLSCENSVSSEGISEITGFSSKT